MHAHTLLTEESSFTAGCPTLLHPYRHFYTLAEIKAVGNGRNQSDFMILKAFFNLNGSMIYQPAFRTDKA